MIEDSIEKGRPPRLRERVQDRGDMRSDGLALRSGSAVGPAVLDDFAIGGFERVEV